MMVARQNVRFDMTFRTSAAAISLVALLGFSSALSAQQAKTPSLEEILERLDANLNHYDASVPSFFCDEHVVSQVEHGSRTEDTTVTDSIFRLRRTLDPDNTTALVESRQIKTVNDKSPTSQKMDGPTMLSGAFEGGLAVVSLKQAACTNYKLQRVHKKRPADPYVVSFATVLMPQNTARCLLKENSKGRVFIDPASMQITHLELTTPHHVITPGDIYRSPFIGERVITVDYAPVLLGGETFWMPSTIDLRVTSGAGTFHKSIWSFRAAYRNYHKLEVKSRILPGFKKPAR
ncbi:hypothetical protein GCM10011585_02510 [Edaphobacter dinghuensis]|uniref:Outer membrane lipoprotein-sorting protein n=2 Tax=Edaphobacter dinghuensis TaxID=1560005 RepID=A0A917H1C1_9BACT|nr:hypothetical protein GCM10011585_02510 [Edaphobacter dinghuensis]